MPADKSLLSGATTLLILKLLEEADMYGYQMIEALAQRSDQTFSLKAGTLYPLLHGLEQQGLVDSYDQAAGTSKVRKYYALTPKGRKRLTDQAAEWEIFAGAVNKVLKGEALHAT